MKKIDYREFTMETLNKLELGDLFVYFDGFRVIVKKTDKEYIFNLNDEVMDIPFSNQTISILSKKFPQLKDFAIASNWARPDPPFHDHNLTFRAKFSTIQAFKLIEFVFESIYQIND